MSVDLSPAFTAAELVAAAEGREGSFLVILRDAAAQIEETIRQRVLRDAAALGLDVEALALTLDGGSAPIAKTPAKRERTKPAAPADDAGLLKVLFVELDKGEPLTAKALARRTGATAERINGVLHANEGDRLKLHGFKWSRKAAP